MTLLTRCAAFSALTCIALPTLASADGLCQYYQRYSSSMYQAICTNDTSTARPAGASSTFNSAFNLNSASLPTEPTSYGLEVLGHRIRSNGEMAPVFAIVKGFQKFGAGISTGSSNTFYGDDILQRLSGETQVTTFKPHEPARGKFTNLNLGTSLRLLGRRSGPSLRLGLSARYNRITDTWGGGPALMLSARNYGFGAGMTRERISNFLPAVDFHTLQASVRAWGMELEYTRLMSNAVTELRAIDIVTGTLTLRRLVLTAAARRLNYFPDLEVIQHHYAIQYLFSSHLSAGILFNQVPGSTSLGIQYYL